MYNFDFEENEKWKKTLDLTHAVWRVVDLCVENDILKNKIKELSSEILSSYTVYVSEHEENIEQKILRDIDSLIALLSLAQKTNYIKEINFLILKNEYKKIKFYLRSSMDSKELTAQQERKHTIEVPQENKVSQKTAVSDNIEKPAQGKISDENKIKNNHPRIEIADERKVTIDNLNHRQEMLLKLFQNRKDSQVRLKDIMQSFPDFTDRTIRNDLKILCEIKALARSNGRGQGSFYYLIRKS